jgi:hypothetical protein
MTPASTRSILILQGGNRESLDVLARRKAATLDWHAHTATVTRRKVAGMEVASSLGLAFWALKRASHHVNDPRR